MLYNSILAAGLVQPADNSLVRDGAKAIRDNAAATYALNQATFKPNDLTYESLNTLYVSGIYRNSGGNVTTARGYPVANATSIIVVLEMNATTTMQQCYTPTGMRIRWRNNSTTFGAWQLVYGS